MALKVVTMAELRLDVLTEPSRTGETVADVCRRYGISRDTYYRYRCRYLAQGLDGLEDQSRRPKTSTRLWYPPNSSASRDPARRPNGSDFRHQGARPTVQRMMPLG